MNNVLIHKIKEALLSVLPVALIVLILYFIAPQTLKNTVLLISSLVFYGWGEPKYVVLMVASIIIGYVSGLLIEAKNNKRDKKVILFISFLLI